jgi:hypothetical protein
MVKNGHSRRAIQQCGELAVQDHPLASNWPGSRDRLESGRLQPSTLPTISPTNPPEDHRPRSRCMKIPFPARHIFPSAPVQLLRLPRYRAYNFRHCHTQNIAGTRVVTQQSNFLRCIRLGSDMHDGVESGVLRLSASARCSI